MVPVQGDKVPGRAGAREEVEAAAAAGVLRQAPVATVCAPTAERRRRTNWGRHAMNGTVRSVGHR
ncbi:MAG: hypothetical protein RBS57_04795 [Desulforhabdus sp.]|nr:hypothetical protein [Desulforhabdus sp.]